MGNVVQIYCLLDPRTGEPRYVGKTTAALRLRLAGHVGDVRRGRVYIPRHRWIAELLSDGVTPEIVEIDAVPAEGWQEAEQFWIAYLRFVGFSLLNATAGGDGISTYKHTERAKARQREAALSRYADPLARIATGAAVRAAYCTPEARRNVKAAAAQRNYPTPTALIEHSRSPEGRAKTSRVHKGKSVSDTTRKKLSDAAMGRKRSAASRAKQAASRRGAKHSPETIAKIRATWAKRKQETGL